jgi:hypothetical protein
MAAGVDVAGLHFSSPGAERAGGQVLEQLPEAVGETKQPQSARGDIPGLIGWRGAKQCRMLRTGNRRC